MGKRGPKKTPTAKLRLVNSRKAEERRSEPKPERGIPTCPTFLDREAKAEWKRVTPKLDRMGLLAKIDRATLAAYCQTWSDYTTAVKSVKREGTVITVDMGKFGKKKMKNPRVMVLNEARSALYRYASIFGLSPSSRADLATPFEINAGDVEKDPLSAFVARKSKRKA